MTTKLWIAVRYVFLLGISFSVMWGPELNAQAARTSPAAPAAQAAQWKNPFADVSAEASGSSDSLTLPGALRLVSRANSLLRSGVQRIRAAEGLVTQAGLRPNPEFAIEAEEVGGDAAGFSESEINITLSQEFELWGKRGARKKLAKSEAQGVRLGVMFMNFDIYALTVDRFFRVAHAQARVELSQEASRIAQSVAETARIRVTRGATLKSELLLGELEFERAQLNLAQAESELSAAKERLSSLWKAAGTDFSVERPKTDLDALTNIERFQPLVEAGRVMSALNSEEKTFKARLNLEQSNAKPSLTLSGGVKRLEVDNANTFIIGAGLPLPFFNRNQGSTASLRASIEALKLEREQALTDAETEFKSIRRTLALLKSRYRTLNTALVPKAEETYSSLKNAYDRGRIPYSILLESQRTLIDLKFELNDIDLAIRQEIVSLERLLGVTIN